ncbi:3'-phosphoadenosine 5'-phosphosulfate (PAPS) 3'-phosphatase [Xenococcus sp. PCC 7305]|uniref:3'(2'),5'-bisphosphate nucleotidase CysQ family protein n=1 Tax=Xenococcus sp. PCC 7305 TaxID=102125 RepID=UPI0002ABF76F|nr:inositol monophosphatase family protein [Xenococcus sp. PCC 7305]ELS02400.1 3'-phosphoadenosine 5'-phosphosulfate (PAPS) 3'-phosphatase [Xenococcus sp. PCC 7305]
MELKQERLIEITKIACSIAWGAADILSSYYHGQGEYTDLNVKDKKDGPVTAADLAANKYIVENLQAQFSDEDFGYLSEETFDVKKAEPVAKDWVWIIDPLDGTRDFIDKTGEYGLHIALAYQGRPVIGLVGIPEAGKLYYALKGEGTFVQTKEDKKNTPIRVSQREKLEDLYLIVSRSHRDERFQKLIDYLPLKGKKYMGGVGGKISTILEQESDLYISLSGKSAAKDWDFAAPEIILTEAGGKFSYADGSPVLYNQGDVIKWGCIMATNGHSHDLLCDKATSIIKEIDGEL